MAKVVNDLGMHPLRKYDWEQWLNGQIWELEQGLDFSVETSSFRSTAIGEARKRGGKLRTSVKGDKLRMQFYHDSDT